MRDQFAFNAIVVVGLTKEEGGRHTPFMKGYEAQFFFRTSVATGAVTLPEGVEMVMPGDTMRVSVELFGAIAMEVWQRFAVREDNKAVGAGKVSKIHKQWAGEGESSRPFFVPASRRKIPTFC